MMIERELRMTPEGRAVARYRNNWPFGKPWEMNDARYFEKLNRSVEEFELSVRSHNCLRYAGIQTIGELVLETEASLRKFKSFGQKSLSKVKELLATLGLELGMRFDEHGRLRPGDK